MPITSGAAKSSPLVRAAVVVGAAFRFTAPRVSFWRNGVKIWPSSRSLLGAQHQLAVDSEANSSLVSYSMPVEFQDSPQSAAEVGYAVRLAVCVANFDIQINRREFGAAAIGESHITAMEVGGRARPVANRGRRR